MSQLTINSSSPVLDLSFNEISTLNVQQEVEHIRALILSGNAIDDFSFLRYFPNLQLLHCDSCDLSSFMDVRLDFLPNLTHLVLRDNAFTSLRYLRSHPTLRVLDISNSQIFSLENASAQFPSLQRFQFGSVQVKNGLRINPLQVFRTFFGQNTFAVLQQEQIQNVQFVVMTEGNKVFVNAQKLLNIPVKNHFVNMKCYTISEYQVALSRQIEAKLSQIIDFDINIKESFKMELVHYPTEKRTEILDQLKNQEAESIKNSPFNFNLLQIEMLGEKIAFLIDRSSNQLISFAKAEEYVQKIVDGNNGFTVQLKKQNAPFYDQVEQWEHKIAVEDAHLQNNMEVFVQGQHMHHQIQFSTLTPRVNEFCTLAHPSISRVQYFITQLTHQQLITYIKSELEVFDITVTDPTIKELLSRALESPLDFSLEKLTVKILLKVEALKVPISVQLVENDSYVSNFCLGKYLCAVYQLNSQTQILFTKNFVQNNFQNVYCELFKQGGRINAKLLQNGKQLTGEFVFSFFLNGKLIKEGSEPFVDILKQTGVVFVKAQQMGNETEWNAEIVIADQNQINENQSQNESNYSNASQRSSRQRIKKAQNSELPPRTQ
ncbi:Leucine-rich_repeat domain superfamily [Hexamita inflata]|uniref:Leucine-rich repeat domain superfamily n=1 Tax=Hexamita inflata TaxID=28002 RepID=A0AA86VPZ4_9EUKA|nr:Leucine-rich repeat domain superfamily [Hexamita inflata]